MRIIAGKYKGRQLQGSRDRSIRPTTNKIKEVIFQLLDDYIVGARVLDLFSGSGGLGLEALSRGAEAITFVDLSGRSLRVLQQNLESLGASAQCRTVRKDALIFLRQNEKPFDLIFADPPFPWGNFVEMVPLAMGEANLVSGGLMVVESERSHGAPQEGEGYEILKQKTYDRSIITFFRSTVGL